MSQNLRVGVVGFGSAGAASAILLADAGHRVDLHERAEQNSPVGAGFLLQPTGMLVLQQLGILDELLPQTARVDKLYCRNHRKQLVLNLHYAQLHPNLFGAGTHRSTLLKLLERRASEAGVQFRWASEILTREREGSLSYLRDSQGERHGPYDLVIVADGSRSRLRDQLDIPFSKRDYPWGALWFMGKRSPEFSKHTLWQSVSSTHKLNGYLPTGTEDDLLSLFWSIRMDQIDRWRRASLDQWKHDVLQLTPHAESFLDQVTSHDQLAVAGYHEVVMRRWHGDGVVILGDAAHALSPQLGQGVNLALVDAAALVAELECLPLEQALPAFTKARKKHLGFYQFATRWATPFFQSDYHILGDMRDALFPLAKHMPWARKQMTATMAGLKLGPFKTLPLASYSSLGR